jgi:hypothetical protein
VQANPTHVLIHLRSYSINRWHNRLIKAGDHASLKGSLATNVRNQAESHEAAAALFADNPHLTMPKATVEVMEIMPMPGR